jgi:SAM-dependent methyltransferase
VSDSRGASPREDGVPPRYDAIASWYIEESAQWGAGYMSPLPEAAAGRRILELACGPGRAARLLAQRGALVVGVDLSGRLIAHARAIEAADPVGVRYLVGDATNVDWWDGAPFDGVICEMALMDIDDLHGVARTAATFLDSGGWFAFSLFHPCFPGGEGSASGLPSWHPDRGYASEGWWSIGEIGVRGRVGSNHRMLSTYLNAIIAAGFHFETFVEPPFVVPRFLAARCRRHRP